MSNYKRKAQDARIAQKRIKNASHNYGDFSRCLKKNAYGSQRFAERLAEEQSLKVGYPIRVYQCPNCKFYHLTRKKRWQ